MSKYFEESELACKHCGQADIRPELYELLDNIREAYGSAIIVNSGYRCEAHNKAVGGVATSQHTLGTAADLRPADGDLERLKGICDAVNPCGGVGLNYSSFVHVDARGKRARW